MKDDLRSALTRHGVLYVMMPGTTWMPMLPADNWDTQDIVIYLCLKLVLLLLLIVVILYIRCHSHH